MRGPHFIGAGDTLVGLVDGTYREMPLEDIQQVKATRPAPTHTAILAVSSVGFIVGASALLKKSTAQPETCTDLGCDPSNNGQGGP